MDDERWAAMVARLERHSAERPRAYLLRVAALAGLGFVLLGGIVGVAVFGLALLAGLVVAAAFSGGAALLALFKLAKPLLLLAIPLWFLAVSALKALFVRLPPPQGDEVTRSQAPALFAAIDRMRETLRGPRVHHVLIVDDVNAAAVQRPLFGLVGFPRNYLLLGLPLLESTTPGEAMAIVAHEYGHLAGAHGRFGAFIYRLRLSWATIQALADRWQGFFGRALGRAVNWYAPYFNAYTFVLARANEYAADRAAADLVGPGVVADALKRVNVAGPQYQSFLGDTVRAIGEQPHPPTDLASRWATTAGVLPAAAQGWLEQAMDRRGEVADTHPPLRLRLAALQAAGQPAAAALPPTLQGECAAQAWLGAMLPRLRAASAARWAEQVAQPWSERHAEVRRQRARLDELRRQPQRGADEELERLRLQLLLEPEVDATGELAAYNVAHPDHPAALYLEAVARLERGDDRGLALLDRVIALDGGSIKPACERAIEHCRAHGDDAGAKRYAERWGERHRVELAVEQQARALDPSHPVEPARLDADAMETIRARLRGLDRRGIRALYLVRRRLPADPGLTSCVLGVELTGWARFTGRRSRIVARLCAIDWPVHLVVCAFDRELRAYAKTVKAVAGSRLA